MQKFRKSQLSPSSKAWLKRQAKDLFSKQVKAGAYRSRAAFKLLQLNKRYQFLHQGQIAVDLGAAPGGWTQVLVEKLYPSSNVRHSARIFAIDLLPITSMAGVKTLQGDFLSEEIRTTLELHLNTMFNSQAQSLDVVLSDLSPNISGIRSNDNARAEALWLSALTFAERWLKLDGSFVCKLFQSTEAEQFVKCCKPLFRQVSVNKPAASRDESREVFLVAKGFYHKKTPHGNA